MRPLPLSPWEKGRGCGPPPPPKIATPSPFRRPTPTPYPVSSQAIRKAKRALVSSCLTQHLKLGIWFQVSRPTLSVLQRFRASVAAFFTGPVREAQRVSPPPHAAQSLRDPVRRPVARDMEASDIICIPWPYRRPRPETPRPHSQNPNHRKIQTIGESQSEPSATTKPPAINTSGAPATPSAKMTTPVPPTSCGAPVPIALPPSPCSPNFRTIPVAASKSSCTSTSSPNSSVAPT